MGLLLLVPGLVICLDGVMTHAATGVLLALLLSVLGVWVFVRGGGVT